MLFCSRLRGFPTFGLLTEGLNGPGSDHRSVFCPRRRRLLWLSWDYYGGRGFGLLGTLLIVALLVALVGGRRFGWYSH
jgi:hypothetical protein